MSELLPREYEAVLRSDLGYFAERCFYQLNPQAVFLTKLAHPGHRRQAH